MQPVKDPGGPTRRRPPHGLKPAALQRRRTPKHACLTQPGAAAVLRVTKTRKMARRMRRRAKTKRAKTRRGKKEDPEPPPEPEPEEPDEPLEVRRENFYSAMRETIASHVQSALHELAELLVDCEENVEVCAFEVTPEESLLGDENSVADNPSFAEEEGD
eukprot:Rmarinus@m.4311